MNKITETQWSTGNERDNGFVSIYTIRIEPNKIFKRTPQTAATTTTTATLIKSTAYYNMRDGRRISISLKISNICINFYNVSKWMRTWSTSVSNLVFESFSLCYCWACVFFDEYAWRSCGSCEWVCMCACASTTCVWVQTKHTERDKSNELFFKLIHYVVTLWQEKSLQEIFIYYVT